MGAAYDSGVFHVCDVFTPRDHLVQAETMLCDDAVLSAAANASIYLQMCRVRSGGWDLKPCRRVAVSIGIRQPGGAIPFAAGMQALIMRFWCELAAILDPCPRHMIAFAG